jgi:tetratricopeptide (TPR) repeat protein
VSVTPTYDDWLQRGRRYRAEGQLIDSMLAYRQALRRDARGTDALHELAGVLRRLERRDDAIATWRTLAEVAPHSTVPWLELAREHFASRDYGDALQAAERAHAGDARDRAAELAVAAAAFLVAPMPAPAKATRLAAALSHSGDIAETRRRARAEDLTTRGGD